MCVARIFFFMQSRKKENWLPHYPNYISFSYSGTECSGFSLILLMSLRLMKFVGNTELLIFKKQVHISSDIWIEAHIPPLNLPYHKCDMLIFLTEPFCFKLIAEPLSRGHSSVMSICSVHKRSPVQSPAPLVKRWEELCSRWYAWPSYEAWRANSRQYWHQWTNRSVQHSGTSGVCIFLIWITLVYICMRIYYFCSLMAVRFLDPMAPSICPVLTHAFFKEVTAAHVVLSSSNLSYNKPACWETV